MTTSQSMSVAVSGKVAAAFLSASIAMVVMGVLTFVRKDQQWLVPYGPAAQYGGIFMYSEITWAVLWMGLYIAMRNKERVGTIKFWLVFFLMSLAVATGLAESSLKWFPFPW
jgi:hypothetical protein